MPPCLDVYGLADARTLDAAWSFVSRWAAPEEFERPWTIALDGAPAAAGERQAANLRAALGLGLDDPRQWYTLYLKSRDEKQAYRAMLTFTRDGKLVLGLSVDDAEEGPAPLLAARKLLETLKAEHGCRLGFVAGEESPPGDETEFRAAAGRGL